MVKQKFVKHKVKRQHRILEGVLDLLEEIGKLDGVKKVIPAKISYSPARKITGPTIKLQRQTKSGFKLLAHSKGGIQEIFIVVEERKRKDIENILNVGMSNKE